MRVIGTLLFGAFGGWIVAFGLGVTPVVLAVSIFGVPFAGPAWRLAGRVGWPLRRR